ncbi:MAG: aldehyde dehydrogenase [Candidatus Sericytochromatia bacterium]|nr:MAG: aldehyde dehydrogenase [Candidatus Sericytochromatia bacterium]
MVKKIFINGEKVNSSSSETLKIFNPSKAEIIDEVPNCNFEDVDKAVKSAKNAQKNWAKVPGVEKATLMKNIATKLRNNTKELANLLTLETGKPLIESYDCIDWIAACFDYYAEYSRSSRGHSLPPVARHQVNFTIKEPYGVVVCIAPFNFPLLLMVWKIAPAIAAGNTVVCKPPHQNPLSNLLMAECFDELPPGVINYVTGNSKTGEILINHKDVDMIAFTGSTNVGRHIAETAGKHLKKINLEMGGIDPLLVFEDANLDIAVKGAVWARLLNAGQVCTSAKRIYVVEEIADEFENRVIEYVKTIKVGDPFNPNTDVGPLISLEALEKIENQVKRLHQEGANLRLGGKRVSPDNLKGYYFQPTVFTNVKHGGIATTEEIFGPVINIIRAKNADEMIEMANDSEYGLGASIFTNNLYYTMKAMEEIKAGTFWVNDPLSDNDAGPFGGMRLSGIGRELGEDGLNAFRETKHVHIDYVMENKYYWFPYSERKIH